MDHPNGVRDLSPSTDVVCRTNQKHFFSPIGSPMSKSQLNDLIKPYHLFCSKTPEIANVIDVVSQNNNKVDNGLRNWETSLVQSSADYLPFGNVISTPQHIGDVLDHLPSDDAPMDSPLFYKLGNLSVSNHHHPHHPMDIWQAPQSMTPPLIHSPTPSRKTTMLYDHHHHSSLNWSNESLPGLKVMDPLCHHNGESLPASIMDYKEIRAIWAEQSPIKAAAVRSSLSVPNHAEYLLNRGRSYSNTRSSGSRSRSNSPQIEDDNPPLGGRNHHQAVPQSLLHPPAAAVRLPPHLNGDSPPSASPSELPSPIPIPPKKISKIPIPVTPPVTVAARTRLPTHPMSRAAYHYSPPIRPPMYHSQICNYDIPPDYPAQPEPSPAAVPMSLHHPLNSFPFPRSIHNFMTDEDFLQDGKIRSRSLGEGARDKSVVPSHRYRHKAKMTRHRRNSYTRDEDLTRYELDVNPVLSGQDTRTTLMIKNIPNKYDQEMLLEAINYNFKGTYDFFLSSDRF